MTSATQVLEFSVTEDIKVNAKSVTYFNFENYSRNPRDVCVKNAIK